MDRNLSKLGGIYRNLPEFTGTCRNNLYHTETWSKSFRVPWNNVNVPLLVQNKDNIFTTEGISEQKILIFHRINERVSEANEWVYGEISIFFVNEWLKKWKYYLYFEPGVAHWHYSMAPWRSQNGLGRPQRTNLRGPTIFNLGNYTLLYVDKRVNFWWLWT